VCDPVRITPFPAGFTKYLEFTLLCFSGPIDVFVLLETVKFTPLLGTPPTVTTTLPVVAPAGTGATMFVALQLAGVAAVPLNVTVLVPCVAPKFAPVIVTDLPTPPDVGFKLAMLGAGGFPPPGFEPVPPHPVFVMASTSKSIGSALRRRTSLNVIAFIAKYII
jgi:hypothetical protein